MASIKKHKSGWRAQVFVAGQRKSKVLPTRRAAQDWAARAEWELRNHDQAAAQVTLGEMLERYAREVSPAKRGHRWEIFRIEAMQRDAIGRMKLGDLGPRHLAEWRDRRLREVAPGSVRREMVLLSSALSHARREWQMISTNPMSDVRKPAEPPARDRLPTWGELRRLRYVAGRDLQLAQTRAWWAFCFGMRTAMRAGEICALQWSDIGERTATLHRSKTGLGRVVPLSSHAREMLDELRPVTGPEGAVFQLKPGQLDALWRKVRGRAGVEGLTFHDSRAAALTALSRRVDVLTLARISGHKDVNLLLRVYYRENPEDLAARLG